MKTRAAKAAALAFVLAISPVALERCSWFCKAHHPDAIASRPSCHHASAGATRIGRVPSPCGYDHSATSATIPAVSPARLAAFQPAVLFVTPKDPKPAIRYEADNARTPPGSPPTPRHRSLALRI